MSFSDVKIFPVNGHPTVKANGEFVYNKAFKIKFALMESNKDGKKSLFVNLPGEYYTPKDGGDKKWTNKVECTSKEVTAELQKAILDAYSKRQGKSSIDQGVSKAGTEDQSVNIPF